MALKNWKKVAEGKEYINWVKDKSDEAIRIEKIVNLSQWHFIIAEKEGEDGTVIGIRIVGSPFKNKSQALRFAKAYMRTH